MAYDVASKNVPGPTSCGNIWLQSEMCTSLLVESPMSRDEVVFRRRCITIIAAQLETFVVTETLKPSSVSHKRCLL
jgi:hypothetical protein